MYQFKAVVMSYVKMYFFCCSYFYIQEFTSISFLSLLFQFPKKVIFEGIRIILN